MTDPLAPIPDGTVSTDALSVMRSRTPRYSNDGPSWSLANDTVLSPEDVARAVEALERDAADWRRLHGVGE